VADTGDHPRRCCLQRFRTETASDELDLKLGPQMHVSAKSQAEGTIQYVPEFGENTLIQNITSNVSRYPYILILTIQIHSILRPWKCQKN